MVRMLLGLVASFIYRSGYGMVMVFNSAARSRRVVNISNMRTQQMTQLSKQASKNRTGMLYNEVLLT